MVLSDSVTFLDATGFLETIPKTPLRFGLGDQVIERIQSEGQECMDIRSGAGYPASALSNFAPHRFVLDGVSCGSMEGLLQSLKFDKPHIQVEVCKLAGKAAKQRGRARNHAWQRAQTLWWKGMPMARDGEQYQRFLDRAYQAMFDQSEAFRAALLATGDAVLTHSLGKGRRPETVLTEHEFGSRLMRLRERLKEPRPAGERSREAVDPTRAPQGRISKGE